MSATTPQKSGRGHWLDWLERRINVTELFSVLSHFGFVYTPVDNTRPLREVWDEVLARPVSSYLRWPRVLGLVTAVLFGVEALSGVLLACYYQPTPATAFATTRTIARDVPLGWLIHQVHAWGAYLLIAAVTLRLLRFFWDHLYRAPREVLWVCAVAMGWVVIQLDFTGRLLPWDGHSYWSVVRGLEVISAQPIVGPLLSFLVAGPLVTGDMLIRFYVLHTMLLPALFLGLFFLTFATLRRVGLSGPSALEAARPARTVTYRDHLASVVTLFVLLFAALVTLATLLPLPFHAEADPYSTPPATRPPWYLLPAYALIQGLHLPRWLPGSALLLVSLAVLFLPAWLRRWDTPGQERRIRTIAVAVFGVWVLLAIAGVFVDRLK